MTINALVWHGMDENPGFKYYYGIIFKRHGVDFPIVIKDEK